MNIDAGFFYTLLYKGDPQPLIHVSEDFFEDRWKEVYRFVVGALSDPSMLKLPEVETVSGMFEIEFFETEEEVAFYVGMLRSRRARVALEDAIQKVAVPLIEHPNSLDYDPLEAARELMMKSSEIRRKYRKTKGEILDYNEDVGIRIAEYNKRKSQKGLMGIPYPFPALNDATGGMQGGELTVFFAESGLGKTWMLVQVAITAMESGCAGVCFSQEMKPKRLSMRLDALGARVSPDRFRRGCLTPEEEEKVRAYYTDLPNRPKLHLFGPKDIKCLADFEATLAALRPSISYILWDSPYMICRANEWADRTDFVKGLKELLEDYDIPLFATWQLNRKGEPSFTDAIRTDADHNFVGTDEGLEEMQQIRVFSLKTRDGLKLENLLLRWEIAEGNFEEIGRAKIRGQEPHDYTVDYNLGGGDVTG